VCGVPGCCLRAGGSRRGFARQCDYLAHCRRAHPAATPVAKRWEQRAPGAGHAAAGAAAAATAAARRAEIAAAERPRVPFPQLQGAPPLPPRRPRALLRRLRAPLRRRSRPLRVWRTCSGPTWAA